MNLPNDSVEILDSPMRKDGRKVCKRKQRSKAVCKSLRKSGTLMQLSSTGAMPRTPLRTVYESILGHQSNRIRLGSLLGIRKRLRTPILSSPKVPRKLRKCEKSGVNDTVIILSDDDDCEEIPKFSNTSEVICVTDSRHKPSSDFLAKAKNQKKKPLELKNKIRKNSKKEKLKSTNKFDKKNDGRELEIVWSSGNASETTTTSIDKEKRREHNNGSDKNASFFVDTSGDASLLLLDSLVLDDKNNEKDNGTSTGKINKEIGKKIQEETDSKNEKKLREIIVDGCNVAMLHAKGHGFSEKGLKIVLDYFIERGHKVKIFLPQHKRGKNRKLLEQWYRQGIVVFTPSRKIGQKNITPYDDRYILDYTTKCHGIVISSDQYRDLWAEKPEWRETIEKRLLPPTFVGDYVMFPEDPLGRFGPKLDEFLKFS